MVRPETHGCNAVSKDVTPENAEPETEGAEAGAEGEESAKPKGIGLIPMVIAAVVVAGAAGGAAFVFTPGAKNDVACAVAEYESEDAHGDAKSDDHAAPAEPCVEEASSEKHDGGDHGDEKKKDKKKKKKDGGGHGKGDGGESAVKPLGAVQHTEYATFLVVEPMIVSIQPIGRSKHLKISLVFETDDDGAEEMLEHGFYIQDVLNTFLRSVDATVLEDPAAMSRLRAQILRRIRAIVPDAEVSNVLITEFVLT